MRKSHYSFKERVWAEPGVKLNYDATPEIQDEIVQIHQLYPELDHWGDLALFTAWGSYSQDHHDMNWYPLSDRDETFLGYLYQVEHQKDEWDWSEDVAEHAVAEVFD